MSDDLSQRLDLLRDLYERVRAKEAVPSADFTALGLKDGARLKDIEKAISAAKKNVSSVLKGEVAAEEQRELAALAKENNMSLEEFMIKLKEESTKVRHFTPNDAGTKKTAQQRGLAVARAKKVMQRDTLNGDY